MIVSLATFSWPDNLSQLLILIKFLHLGSSIWTKWFSRVLQRSLPAAFSVLYFYAVIFALSFFSPLCIISKIFFFLSDLISSTSSCFFVRRFTFLLALVSQLTFLDNCIQQRSADVDCCNSTLGLKLNLHLLLFSSKTFVSTQQAFFSAWLCEHHIYNDKSEDRTGRFK